ncbi:MAG: deoxyribonuclease IV [Kiritimatiellia bacterium]|jgi:deoxyribonuclease-4
MFYVGCHLSVASGFAAMGRDAIAIGANVFQFFTRNPRGGAAKPIDPDDVAEYLALAEEHGFGTMLAHASYTVNPSSATPRTREFAIETMADDLDRLENVPGSFYNFHPGSHVGQGIDRGIELVIETLDAIMTSRRRTTVLLETMAGKGSEIGSTFEELRRIMDGAKLGDRLGVCLDTCHISDAGYDIGADLDGVLEAFDRVVGLDRLKAIHLNDSKNPTGARKDRHARIGEGTLGVELLARVVNHPSLRDLPFYLETPNDLDGYAAEIALLKRLREDRP